jgi:hypothetical protein
MSFRSVADCLTGRDVGMGVADAFAIIREIRVNLRH